MPGWTTTIYWYGNRYAELRSNPGVAHTYSIIFDFKKMTHSPVLKDVYGIDPKRNIIALYWYSGPAFSLEEPNSIPPFHSNESHILVTAIHDPSRGMIISFPSGSAPFPTAPALMNANFDDQGNLKFVLHLGKDWQPKKFSVSISTAKLGSVDPKMFNAAIADWPLSN